MSLAAGIAVGFSQLHLFVTPCLTQPFQLLLHVLQLHGLPFHDPVLLLQRLHCLFSFLGALPLLCQLYLDLQISQIRSYL